ncbi:hypothetical protein Nmel_008610, partial [Mimus melanotis]
EKLEKLQLSRALVKASSALRSCPATSAYQRSQCGPGAPRFILGGHQYKPVSTGSHSEPLS